MRQLEVTLDVPANLVHTLPLPEGWDEMTEAERENERTEAIETIKWNRVGGTARVIEARD